MADRAFRFLHAADFRLDQSIAGLSEIPDHLRQPLADAPYRAAERVFEAAILEEVAFVVLSGNLLDLQLLTPRALTFLRTHFEQLAEYGIPVYWSGGRQDGTLDWPDGVELPDNVVRFGRDEVRSCSFTGPGGVVANIQGRSWTRQKSIPASEFADQHTGPFSIAVVSGRGVAQQLSMRAIDYWALGGRNDRHTLFTEPHVGHFPGTPQGRSPSDTGPHGCTLVEVADDRGVKMRLLPCDAVRWEKQCVSLQQPGSWDPLRQSLERHVAEMRARASGRPLLVNWSLEWDQPSAPNAGLGQLAERAVLWLREQFGHEPQPCWSIAVECDSPDQPPADWFEEDSLLGDYLRSTKALQSDDSAALLPAELVQSLADHKLSWIADISDPQVRQHMLQQATQLGAVLLRGAP